MVASRQLSRFTSIIALAGLGSVASGQIRYEVIVPDIYGAAPTSVQESGNRINERGQTLINRITSFAIWEKGSSPAVISARLEAEESISGVNAAAINVNGQVVGSRQLLGENGKLSRVPFSWTAESGLVDLSELATVASDGTRQASFADLNDLGVAIGSARNFSAGADLGTEGFLWSAANGKIAIPALDSFGGVSVTSPRSINANNLVAGIFNRYNGSANAYFEEGFLYDQATGARALRDIDANFFGGVSNSTARSLSDNGLLVGEIGSKAYLYDLDGAVGVELPAINAEVVSSRAHAVNELGVVAGYATMNRDGVFSYAPFLWTHQTGSVNLLEAIETRASSYLPEGLAPEQTLITPKSINDRGQISAQLEAKSGPRYEREIVLEPVLDFRWTSIEQTSENGVRGILYRFSKTDLAAGQISADALGLEIAFFCSGNLESWNRIRDGVHGVRLSESDESIELFAPLDGCMFIKAELAQASGDVE